MKFKITPKNLDRGGFHPVGNQLASAKPVERLLQANPRIAINQSVDVVDGKGNVLMTLTHCGRGIRLLGKDFNSIGLIIRPRVSNVVEVVVDDEPPF